MNKIRRFFKSRLGFALILSVVFGLLQIPIVLRHQPSLVEVDFYYQYFAPLGLTYAVARFVPLVCTTLLVFLLSLILPFQRLTKVCLAFSSLFFYFNSVLLAGFRLIPAGRTISFVNPISFFDSLNEALYHTFLPVLQLCLIPIIIYLLNRLCHFKALRKLELIKFCQSRKIPGTIVFLLPIALSIPNAVISAGEDFFQPSRQAAASSAVVAQLNELPAEAIIAFGAQDMREFAFAYQLLLTDGRQFYDLTKQAAFAPTDDQSASERLNSNEAIPRFPEADHLYYLLHTNSCTPTKFSAPQTDWEYLGTVRQLDELKAYDLYRIR